MGENVREEWGPLSEKLEYAHNITQLEIISKFSTIRLVVESCLSCGSICKKNAKLIFLLTVSLITVQVTAMSRSTYTARIFGFVDGFVDARSIWPDAWCNLCRSEATAAFLYETREYRPNSRYWYLIIRFCNATCAALWQLDLDNATKRHAILHSFECASVWENYYTYARKKMPESNA